MFEAVLKIVGRVWKYIGAYNHLNLDDFTGVLSSEALNITNRRVLYIEEGEVPLNLPSQIRG